jgi:hypothetical protein
MSAVDVELTHDGLARNLGLKLLVEAFGILDDLAAAIGALFGQRRLKAFIDALGQRRFAMSVLAVLLSLFAARLLGPFLGFALGKRRGLAFGDAFEFLNAFLLVANRLRSCSISRSR